MGGSLPARPSCDAARRRRLAGGGGRQSAQPQRKDAGGGGLPSYEGYLFHFVVTDSKGNHFKIFETGTKGEKYTDDYQKVLDGTIKYDDKGERVFE